MVAFNTFHCRGLGATWCSPLGTQRRLDFICGPVSSLALLEATWVARDLDVASIRDDHFPVIAQVTVHPVASIVVSYWCCSSISRPACIEGDAANPYRHALSIVVTPPVGTPVDALYSYVVGAFFGKLAPCVSPFLAGNLERIGLTPAPDR